MLEKNDLAQVLEELKEGMETFADTFPVEDFAQGDYKQYPAITLLNCADSRTPVSIFGPLFNRVFCIENIGNQVKSNEGSILYGLLHLHTPLMIVAGHTDCGALKAAGSNFVDEPFSLRNELSTVKKSLEEAQASFQGNLSDDPPIRYSQLSELNVDMQINYLLSNPGVKELVEAGKLMLLGLQIDLHNIWGEGHGKIFTVNVNGQNNIAAFPPQTPEWFRQRARRST